MAVAEGQTGNRLSVWLFVAGTAWLASLVVASVLVLNALFGPSLPAGCIEKDKQAPGCRPTGPSVQYALPFGAVVITPLLALVVAIITARTTDERQERALAAEAARLDKQLAEERKRFADAANVDAEQARADKLRDAGAAFVAAIAQVRYLSYSVNDAADSRRWPAHRKRRPTHIDQISSDASRSA